MSGYSRFMGRLEVLVYTLPLRATETVLPTALPGVVRALKAMLVCCGPHAREVVENGMLAS